MGGGSNIVCMPFLHDFKCFSFPIIPHILFLVLLHAHASMLSCYAFTHVQFTEVPPVVLLDKVFECSWNCVHDSVASSSTQQLSATDARVKAQILVKCRHSVTLKQTALFIHDIKLS